MLFYESTDKLRSQNGAGNEGRGGLLVRQDAVMEGGQRYEYTSNILNTFQQSMKTACRRKGLSVLTHWPFLCYRRIMRLDDFGQIILLRLLVRHLVHPV